MMEQTSKGLPQEAIDLNTRVVVSSQQVSSQLDGETVILNIANGVYYGLDAVGMRVWDLLQSPVSVQSICAALMTEYDVTQEACERDVLDLLQGLVQAQLIEVLDAVAA
jgi:hypothetical protein